MKDQELELQVAPMSNDTMEYLNVLFGVYVGGDSGFSGCIGGRLQRIL